MLGLFGGMAGNVLKIAKAVPSAGRGVLSILGPICVSF